ncbi:tail fiber assembly protein [Collimonas humicola]|uniref:tail fiber assembly protein n=1 Tax=Collimonas humicola TaxID=2825886 RepID=UPI001B8AC126|nr:tail fiber assembly protein [Collimonas humicola]
MTKAKQAIEQVTDIPAAESGEVAQALSLITEPAPIPPAPRVFSALPPPQENVKPVDPFAYSDIKDVVRMPNGFQCAVKFDAKSDYLTFLACADDVEAHGRAIYKACAAKRTRKVLDYLPTDVELLQAVQERISRELRRANSEVTKYQDRVDIDDASAADVALLRAWKVYRVGLNRLPEQESFPHPLTWPVAPDTAAV